MTLSNIQKCCAYESIHLMLRLWKLTYSLTWCCMEHRQEWHRAAHPPSQGNQSGSLTSSHPTDKRKSFTKKEETETQPHDPESKSRLFINFF